MPQNKYWILSVCREFDSAVITAIPLGSPKKYRFFKNQELLSEYPENAETEFSRNHPDNIKLYDFVRNTVNLLIISAKVKQVFDESGVDQIEYLPLTILDHQEEIAADDYFIVNQLVSQPIIDMEKSDYTMGNLDKTQISSIKELHLDIDAVDSSLKSFRATQNKLLYFFTDDVIQNLKKAKVTGLNAMEAEGWNGKDYL